jgi:CDP-paratose 2-epimerase
MEYRHILITGGAGFVGSSLALRFKQRFPGAQVTCVDNLIRKGSELNLPRLQKAGVTFARGDVRKAETFEPFTDIDLFVDCAAEPSVMAGADGSPLYALETNLWGTVNALECARRSNARFLFLSSSRVYPLKELESIQITEGSTRFTIAPQQLLPGISERGISEQFPLGEQRTLYGATKLASEMLVKEYALLYGLKAIINRCGVIAGPWQFGKVDQGVAVLWMTHFVFGKPLSYIGYGGMGKQVRDFLHVEDLCDALLIQLNDFEKYASHTFNIGGGVESSTSLLELSAACERISGMRVPIAAVPETRWGDIPLYISDTTRFEAMSDWRPKRSIEVIMRDIHAWILANQETLQPLFR